MIYDIQRKSDMVSGATLVVNVPEEDLDYKALYTMLEDRPDYILPFRYRIIDGTAEFVYSIGKGNRLQYISGERLPTEYIELWSSIVRPLCNCGDWFLKPYSFVLDMNHIYCDKSINTVCYVYIPSIKDCSDIFKLKDMVAEVSGQITVSDNELENKILKAIMMDFDPKAFIQVLQSSMLAYNAIACLPAESPQQQLAYTQGEPSVLILPPGQKDEELILTYATAQTQDDEEIDDNDDIIIDLSATSRKEEKKKKRIKEKAFREQKGKKMRSNKNRLGVFWKRIEENQETIPRNSLALQHIGSVPIASSAINSPKYDLPQSFSSSQISLIQPVDDATHIMSYEVDGAWLRLAGSASLPDVINVVISEGEVFTIGRNDTTSSRARSSFEFDRMTKGVSRRHAAIERIGEEYTIVDISSSAGTFVDGNKIPPNTPFRLTSRCRVSFGNCGADYIWEQ